MKVYQKPSRRPTIKHFSSGPTNKRPGWSPASLSGAFVGRSHRSEQGQGKINQLMDLSREILGLPKSYLIGMVPGSDTGAVEMAIWSLLGPRKVEVLAWDAFGKEWLHDIVSQLKISHVKTTAPYGHLPDLSSVDFDCDVVFTWNGTTAGVKVPNGDWIPNDRKGLTIIDATSACFAMALPWKKLDVVTFSFQKALGGSCTWCYGSLTSSN